MFPIFNNFLDTLYEGWFGCKDFPRQGSVYWGGGGGGSFAPKKVFPEKKLKSISNSDLI